MKRLNLRGMGVRLLAAAVLAAGRGEGVSEDIVSLRARLTETLEQIQTQCRDKKAQSLPAYGSTLVAAEKKAQQAGNLDVLMAIRAERLRFEKEKTVPATPDAGAGQHVQFLQSLYQKSLADAENERDKAIVAAAKQHVERLDQYKRELTRKGNVDAALQVKVEQDGVSAMPVVAAAEAALANAAAVPQPALLGTACAGCGGTGESGTKCATCDGSGKCTMCMGQGQRTAGLKGSEMLLRCSTCDATGKCRVCGGTGKAKKEACSTCGGLGRVLEVAPPRTVAIAAPATPATPAVSPPVPDAAATTNAPAGDAGVPPGTKATLERLREVFQAGKSEAADLADVFERREAYAGKVLTSKCLLTGSAARSLYLRVEVSRTSSISCSMRVSDPVLAEKAQGLLGGKSTASVKVTYGVDEAGDRHAFDVVTAAD